MNFHVFTEGADDREREEIAEGNVVMHDAAHHRGAQRARRLLRLGPLIETLGLHQLVDAIGERIAEAGDRLPTGRLDDGPLRGGILQGFRRGGSLRKELPRPLRLDGVVTRLSSVAAMSLSEPLRCGPGLRARGLRAGRSLLARGARAARSAALFAASSSSTSEPLSAFSSSDAGNAPLRGEPPAPRVGLWSPFVSASTPFVDEAGRDGGRIL